MADDWNIKGKYVETCNCSVPCQCLWQQPPDDGECTTAVFWYIDDGTYGDVSLDGLTVGILLWEEGMFLEGGWHVVLVLDEAADIDQADALEAIFSGQAGGLMGAVAPMIEEVKDVVTLPITHTMDDGHFLFEAGDVVSMAADESLGIEGERGSVYPHAFIQPHMEAQIGESTEAVVSYDDDFSWDVAGNNAYFGEFDFGTA